MSTQIYLRQKYIYENAGYCINDFRILKILKQTIEIFRGQNRYVTLPLSARCTNDTFVGRKPVNKKIHTLSRLATLRAISNFKVVFYTPCITGEADWVDP